MKYLSKIAFTIILSFVFFSCNNEEIENISLITLNTDLKTNIKLTKTTNLVTPLLNKLGVTEIKVKKNKDIKYVIKTEKGFIFEKELINFSDYEFKIENNFISCNKFPNFELTTVDKKIYVKSKEFNGFINLNENSEVAKSKEITILLIFMTEIFTSEEQKKSLNLYKRKRPAPCSFWDTYYIINRGFSRSEASFNAQWESRLADRLIELTGSSCSSIGDTDTSCLWENHACISTTAYCCPDNDPPY